MFFISSKIIWLIIAPSSLLCALFLISLISLIARKHHMARLCGVASIALFLFIGCTSFADRALGKWERQYPLLSSTDYNAQNIAGVIVLGGGVDLNRSKIQDRLVLSHYNGDRIIDFITLIQRHADLDYIYSGGSGAVTLKNDKDKAPMGEADYAKPFISALTKNPYIYYESESKNTYQNALYAKHQYISEIDALWPTKKPWLLVTSAYHMPRSYAVFKALEWNVIAYPSAYICDVDKPLWHITLKFWENWGKIDILAREIIGMMAYRFTNRL